MLFITSGIHVGRFFTIILEKVRRLNRATLMLGKTHHGETKMLDGQSFDFWTKQLCKRTSCSQDLAFPRVLTIAK